jgi:serine protease Do
MSSLVALTTILLAWAETPAAKAASPADAREIVSALESSLADAIEQAEPSVVAIAREKNDAGGETTAVRGRNPEADHRDPRHNPVNRPPLNGDWLSFDYGSGVVIGDHGEILTAYHVVSKARRLVVRATRRQAFEAEIIAADPRSDLAVIVPREAGGLPPPKLKPIKIGDASRLRKGTFLVALGNPFNAAWDGTPSASWGILANVARRLIPQDEERMAQEVQLRHYPTLLQLDSKLNIGMSGGAVINLRGELVGLTTGAASVAGFDAQAGYAIPMDLVYRRAIDTLRQGKEVEYGLLGILLDTDQGTNRIMQMQLGTPAADGGLLAGDSIVAVDGRPTSNAEALQLAINTLPAGSVVKLKILRENETLEKTVELAKYRTAGAVIATNRPAPWRGLRVDYLSMLANVPLGNEQPDHGDDGGVLVVEVEPDSPAEKAGLKAGHVIRQVGAQKVHNPREFARAIKTLAGPAKLLTRSGPVTLK